MKKCEVCGKRAEGLGVYPVEFESVVVCSNCYEGLSCFKTGRKFKDAEEAETKHKLAVQEMQEKQFPPHVVQVINTWFLDQQKKFNEQVKFKLLDQNLDNFMMTTGFTFEGYQIQEYFGVISGESVLGTGFISSWNASWSDTFGVESEDFINKLKEARDYAKRRAVKVAIEKGANAIIGVDINYTMFTSNLIGVVYNGTAVHIEKNKETS